jgi:hypothetical protein
LQGFFRYDDPAQHVALVCPQIALLERVGPNARRFVALCLNEGEAGWAVSGQVTDGSGAAPDSIGLTVDGPDGAQWTLTGQVSAGAVIVREATSSPPRSN